MCRLSSIWESKPTFRINDFGLNYLYSKKKKKTKITDMRIAYTQGRVDFRCWTTNNNVYAGTGKYKQYAHKL